MKRQSLADEDQSVFPFRRYPERQEPPRKKGTQAGPRQSSEGLSAYLKAISKIPLLTKGDEQQLARRVRKGDAVSTYASKWIRQAVTKTLATDSRTVRLPANVIETIRKVRATEESMLRNEQTEPAEGDVCSRLGLSSARYAQMANASSSVSLDAPCSPDGEVNLHEMLADQSGEMPDRVAFQHIDSDKLESYLRNLSKRERRILSYRFGLEDGNLRSLAETGKMVGITRERIRQIEKRAIEKIRRMMKKRRMHKVLMQRQ